MNGRSPARDRTPPGPSGTGGRLTILVNGVDPVDLAGCEDESGDQPAALSCRLYRRVDGRISPTLDPADVRAALEVALRLARGGTRAWAQPDSSPAWSFATRCATLLGLAHSCCRTRWIDEHTALHNAPFSPHYVGLKPPRVAPRNDRNSRRCWGLGMVRTSAPFGPET
jgi:hypothetical protein